jgi:hypothetical protein
MLSGDFTFGEFRSIKEMGALFLIKVRLEAFMSGFSISGLSDFLALKMGMR